VSLSMSADVCLITHVSFCMRRYICLLIHVSIYMLIAGNPPTGGGDSKTLGSRNLAPQNKGTPTLFVSVWGRRGRGSLILRSLTPRTWCCGIPPPCGGVRIPPLWGGFLRSICCFIRLLIHVSSYMHPYTCVLTYVSLYVSVCKHKPAAGP
jgi:hypothetical protein